MRTLLLVLALAVGAQAELRLTVAQLIQMVQSSVKLKHPDRQVADYLKQVKLSESLDARLLEELQGMGAGPRTMAALRDIAAGSFNLPKPNVVAPTVARVAPLAAPTSEEQGKLLDELREYALSYNKRLPDFICTQVTRRYIDPSGMEFWRMQDVVAAKLSYFEQREDYKVVLVNNRPTDVTPEQLGGATSRGEFGTMLRDIFDPAREARFEWERWATLRGRRAHVFAYEVPRERSEWRVSYERRAEAVAGMRGLIYVDRDLGVILRVTFEATDLPAGFPVQQAGTVMDYDFAALSGQEHIVPLRAVVRMRAGKMLVKNEVEFRNYQKFGSDVVITAIPEALPDEKPSEAAPSAKP